MKRSQAKLLHDALSAGREIEQHTVGATYEQLLSDRSLQLIFERLFEILGEALSNADQLDPALREQLPEADGVIGIGNSIAHGDVDVSYRVIWDAAVGKVPALCTTLEQMLDD